MLVRTADEFTTVKRLISTGMSDYAIAQATGIPRGTVQRWHHRAKPPATAVRAARAHEWEITDPRTYCYLLGSYLGDGCITHRPPNGWTLRIACDEKYVGIVDAVRHALAATFPGGRITQRHATVGASEVVALSHPCIGRAFPQHGPGRKHDRKIELVDWQLELTHAHPDALVRGLIHSDGCRCVNSVKTRLPSGRDAEYFYVRYFFTNHSADIRGIFIEHCELLGIRVTQSNHRNLSVSHRKSVAILERIVGPKS